MSGALDALESQPAKAATYVAYNLYIGSLAVGIVRLAIAIYHIAMHAFNAEGYRQIYNAYASDKKQQKNERTDNARVNERRRAKENSRATTTRQRATGFNKLTALGGEALTKGKNAIKNGIEHIQNEVADLADEVESVAIQSTLSSFEDIEKAKMKAWRGEAIRGLIEIIPLGAVGYTIYDLTHKDIHVLGLQELQHAIEVDDLTDFDFKSLRSYL